MSPVGGWDWYLWAHSAVGAVAQVEAFAVLALAFLLVFQIRRWWSER